MEQNPFKNDPNKNFTAHEDKLESMPGSSSSNEIEKTTEDQMLDLISNGQWASHHTIELMQKWREQKFTEIYNSKENKIPDEEVHNLYIKERDILLNKAVENLKNDDPQKFVDFINQNNLL
jgi:coenzyme F420-reducing hydrogenase alpha subunit